MPGVWIRFNLAIVTRGAAWNDESGGISRLREGQMRP